MGVEVIQDQDHFVGMGITYFQQVLDDSGEIHGGASIGHGDVPLSGEGFNGHEQIGCLPFVLIVHPLRLTRFGGQQGSGFRHQLLAGLVQADHRVGRIIGSV